MENIACVFVGHPCGAYRRLLSAWPAATRQEEDTRQGRIRVRSGN
jgi:hypothetical protein